jgi:hypothetical protein
MLGIALLGLLVNLFVARRLHGHAAHSLNMRGAYLHVLSDTLGSVGALLAALVILADRLGAGRHAHQRAHRRPDLVELVVAWCARASTC